MTTPARLDAQSRRREWVPSVATASVVAVFMLITPRVTDYSSWDGGSSYAMPGGFDQLTVVGSLSVVVGVVLGRRWPVWATALTLLPFIQVPWNGGFVWGWWLGMLAVAALAAIDGLRRALVPAAATVMVAGWYCSRDVPAYLPIGPVTSGFAAGYGIVTWALYVVATTAVVGIAAAIGSGQRSRVRDAVARGAERHALQVESLAGERARLARDLHDVVAHHVSLVAVRAESAPFLHPDLNGDARAVLADIATDAREALTELRQVLVVLQRTSDEGERTPQPTACDVDDLVAGAVAAGQPVELDGSWRDVAPAVGYVLFRAVQEGLTNARRHAPGTTTVLTRTQTDRAAGFVMSNPAEVAHDPGRGLIGMRERVEALGGTMTAVVVDKEFVLEVAVPT